MSSSFLSLQPSALGTTAPENNLQNTAAYSSAFPPLHSIPLAVTPSNKHKPWQSFYPPKPSLLPPKYPLYLKNTNYAKLADEQYHQQCRIKKATKPMGTISSLFHKSEPAVQYDAALEQLDLRLPCFWNPNDKSSLLDISSDGVDASYCGSGRNDHDAAAVRSTFTAKPQCGIFYFEIEIVSKGRDGYISIGFCDADASMDKLPGWEVSSYGLHANDGNCYNGVPKGKSYGPTFSTGDVVGCGINFSSKNAFFTKNGVYMGTAFSNVNPAVPLYPCVGLRTPGEHIRANFGFKTFQFDIVQYMNEEKCQLHSTISQMQISPSPPTQHTSPAVKAAWMKQVGRSPEPVTPPKTSQQVAASSEIIDQLVYSFLLHHGYSRTAEVLLKNVKDTKDADLVSEESIEDSNDQIFDSKSDLVHRQDIRTAIIAGDIDCAIKLTQAHFPQVLVHDELMLFRLQKRKFIEMLRLANESCNHSFCDAAFNYGFQPLTTTAEEIDSTHPHDLSTEKSSPTVFGTPRKMSVPAAPISTAPASDIPQPTRRVSYASITATPSSASPPHGSYFGGRSLDESLDEPISPTSTFSHTRRRRRSSSHISFTSLSSFEEDDDDIKSDMREAIRFGHLLQEQYGRDQRTMVKSGMADIHSLINEVETYHSLCVAVKALDIAGRDTLASELNTAILVSQRKPAAPPLELVYRQSVATIKELVRNGHGQAALVSVDDSLP
ncbi:hypothetical protein K450DRAFT_192816 [Umbelopsis ramanniana AG]|uniref:Uncharacterized protein n=1 Tax=Umbelopsis ramanniana AG TaxID=1314678 RepID=A0AAD5E4W3_UMBRA|nr:uncharacterized protein K450DRAFT_192816 [Umbelopsis ramanniana AG]KAI8576371.1 hypothetical protein K450DRAFT_192816 [Umbelopsis ramanniana AG]